MSDAPAATPATEHHVAPIIVKKIKKGGHGHHGGAWKVAYADFVTAMMAFFLLLWLLSSTNQETRDGLADYFSPNPSLSESNSGAGGVLGGLSVASPGSLSTPSSQFSLDQSLPGQPMNEVQSRRLDDGTVAEGQREPVEGDAADEPTDDDMTDEQAQELADFEAVEETLEQALQGAPQLEGLAEHVMIDRTPEGLRIQIVDQDTEAMFPAGSADIYDRARQLIHLVAFAVGDLPHRVSVRGHTDATPFAGGGYGNWELSSDRAHTSRRVLIEAGLGSARIANVMGMADTDLLFPDEPTDPRNRRISIVLLRETEE